MRIDFDGARQPSHLAPLVHHILVEDECAAVAAALVDSYRIATKEVTAFFHRRFCLERHLELPPQMITNIFMTLTLSELYWFIKMLLLRIYYLRTI